jgi:hypothetical protein
MVDSKIPAAMLYMLLGVSPIAPNPVGVTERLEPAVLKSDR